jgi:cell division protein FtsW
MNLQITPATMPAALPGAAQHPDGQPVGGATAGVGTAGPQRTVHPERSPGARRRIHARLPDLDYGLLVCAIAITGFGFVMVASASLPVADHTFGSPFHFVIRHALALGLALAAAMASYVVPVRWWERAGLMLFLVGLAMLALVLVPGLGRTANGATRWIPLGPLNLQSSEFVKFFAVIYVSGYLVRRRAEVAGSVLGFIRPMILMAVASALMLAEPDFGTTAVMLATVMGLLFLGGVPAVNFAVLTGMVGAALAALIVYEPYRLQRLLNFTDPFADPFDKGFQLSQALIAFGRGEWLGVGLGHGIQKQFFLPEAHTDFLMAVVGEEFGFAGVATVIVAFSFLVWRAFAIGARAQRHGDLFAAYLAHGLGLGLGLQAFINIGVNVGLLPTKGLTMPFMSYGSNSLIVALMAVAVLLRVDRTLRLAALDGGYAGAAGMATGGAPWATVDGSTPWARA